MTLKFTLALAFGLACAILPSQAQVQAPPLLSTAPNEDNWVAGYSFKPNVVQRDGLLDRYDLSGTTLTLKSGQRPYLLGLENIGQIWFDKPHRRFFKIHAFSGSTIYTSDPPATEIFESLSLPTGEQVVEIQERHLLQPALNLPQGLQITKSLDRNNRPTFQVAFDKFNLNDSNAQALKTAFNSVLTPRQQPIYPLANIHQSIDTLAAGSVPLAGLPSLPPGVNPITFPTTNIGPLTVSGTLDISNLRLVKEYWYAFGGYRFRIEAQITAALSLSANLKADYTLTLPIPYCSFSVGDPEEFGAVFGLYLEFAFKGEAKAGVKANDTGKVSVGFGGTTAFYLPTSIGGWSGDYETWSKGVDFFGNLKFTGSQTVCLGGKLSILGKNLLSADLRAGFEEVIAWDATHPDWVYARASVFAGAYLNGSPKWKKEYVFVDFHWEPLELAQSRTEKNHNPAAPIEVLFNHALHPYMANVSEFQQGMGYDNIKVFHYNTSPSCPPDHRRTPIPFTKVLDAKKLRILSGAFNPGMLYTVEIPQKAFYYEQAGMKVFNEEKHIISVYMK